MTKKEREKDKINKPNIYLSLKKINTIHNYISGQVAA